MAKDTMQEDLETLPPALREQAEEVAEQARQAKEAAEAAQAEPEQEDDVVEVEEPEAVEDDQPEPEAPEPDENTVDAPDFDATAAPDTFGTPPERKPVTSLAQAEHALRVLQGKYDSEVPRMYAENRALQERISALEAQTAQAQPAQPDALLTATDTSDPSNPYDLDDDEQELGPEVLRIAEKVGKRIAEDAVRRAVEPLQSRFEQDAQVREAQAEEKFFTNLESRASNWRAVNNDPRFVAWLQNTHPGTGKTRAQLLNESRAVRDDATCAWYFKQFTAESQGKKGTAQPKPSVVEQVVPKRSAGSPTPAKRKWTMASWTAANMELSKMEPGARRDKLDKELRLAMAENRVLK